MRVSSSDSKFRSGAQCVKLICSEPSTNTPGAQRRIANFIQPILEAERVKIDHGKKGHPRWLPDRLQLPGIIRRYTTNHLGCWQESVVHDSLNLVFPAHRLELVFLIEHTNCAEREDVFQKEYNRPMNPLEEVEEIHKTLNSAESLLLDWHERTKHVEKMVIVKAVGLVSNSNFACQRRLESVVTLDDYLKQ